MTLHPVTIKDKDGNVIRVISGQELLDKFWKPKESTRERYAGRKRSERSENHKYGNSQDSEIQVPPQARDQAAPEDSGTDSPGGDGDHRGVDPEIRTSHPGENWVLQRGEDTD